MYLSIDQGGHATRALLFDREGACVAEAVRQIDTVFPCDRCVEHDPAEMIVSVVAVVEEVLATLSGADLSDITVGIATQRSSITCWDRVTGEALSPVISWQDRRAADWLDPFQCNDQLIHDTSGLFLTPYYGVSKLNWCMENISAVKSAFEVGRLAWGPMASFLLFHLLDESPMLSDPANASRTLLWSLKSGDWSEALLKLFDLPLQPLPKLVPSYFPYGTLHGHPMRVCTGDQSAAVFAFGEPCERTAYINIGTGAFIQLVTKGTPVLSEKLLSSILFSDGEEQFYALEGTVNGAASALREQSNLLGVAEQRLHDSLPGWLRDKTDIPLFLNGVSGLGSPYWLADFESKHIGDGGVDEKLVAVAESILFLLMINLELLQQSHDTPIEKIVVSGGVSTVDELCQRLADLCSLPVERPANCEATARGTAFLLAGRPKHWPDLNGRQFFSKRENPALVDRYQRWRIAMEGALPQRI